MSLVELHQNCVLADRFTYPDNATHDVVSALTAGGVEVENTPRGDVRWKYGVGRAIEDDFHLLEVVSRDKAMLFPAAWARYSEAKRGSLKLVPNPDSIETPSR
jgi:hypothetical protein